MIGKVVKLKVEMQIGGIGENWQQKLQFKSRIRALPIINNLKEKGQIPMERIDVQCFICGKGSCLEDSDHKKMTFPQFDNLLKSRAGYQPRIVKIKHKIRKCFEILKQATKQNLEPYVIDLFLVVDKLHFWHFLKHTNSLADLQAAIFGSMLPKKRMIKLISLLEEETDPNVIFPKFEKLLSQVHKFKKNWQKVTQNGLYGELIRRFIKIISECQAQFPKNQCQDTVPTYPNLDAGLPTQTDQIIASELVTLEGIPFSTARRSIDLSVLELTDQNFFNCLPALQKMKELVELQIRNSRLSERSYRMLFGALPQLESLDLSTSNSDNFYKVIGEKLPKLKTLYLNETSLSDQKLLKIASDIKNLRVLFADHNKITTEAVEQLFKTRKQLMYASLKGNQISDQIALKIQLNLTFKGGYFEY